MRSRINPIPPVVIAASLALLATLPAAANNSLYQVGGLAGTARSAAAVEERNITLAPQVIDKYATQIELELLNGTRVVATSNQAPEEHGQGELTWRGLIDGAYQVTLTRNGSTVAGYFETEIGPHSIMPRGKSNHTLALLDSSLFGGCGTEIKTSPLSAGPFQGTRDLAPVTREPAGLDNQVDVTVLALYTPQARQEAGGDAQVRAVIQQAIAMGNTALINSDSGMRFVLVHTALANHGDTGNSLADLGWLTNSPQVSTLRAQHEANLVGLITAEIEQGSCGRASGVPNSPNGDPSIAYQVTELSCASDDMTFAHELGHLVGMYHEPGEVDPEDALFPFAFGHYYDNGFSVFKTIMTQLTTCPACDRIANFSNPDVLFVGLETGIEDERDNAQVADLMAPVVALYREPTGELPALVSSYVPEGGGARRESISDSANPPSFTFRYDEDLGNFHQQPGLICHQGQNNPTYLHIRYEGPDIATCSYQFSFGPTTIVECPGPLVSYLNSHQPILIGTDRYEVDVDPGSPNFCDYRIPLTSRLRFNQLEWIRLDLTTESGQSFSRQVNLIKEFLETPE